MRLAEGIARAGRFLHTFQFELAKCEFGSSVLSDPTIPHSSVPSVLSTLSVSSA